MSRVRNVSRRRFLQGVATSGAFVVAARLLPSGLHAQDVGFRTQADASPLNPTVYLGIRPDGTVFIVAHRSEMGTGIRTSLPLVAADELDADWRRVTIEQGIGDNRFGDQNTDGSRSIRDFYEPFRHAGAAARAMLVTAAAAQWKVPARECITRNHQVVHEPSGRVLDYGTLVPAAAKLPVPKPGSLPLKPRAAWTLVGRDTVPYDQHDIVTGRAQFGLDVVRDGMLYASIEHPPVLGGTVRSLDDSAARQVRGVQQTVTLDTFKPPHEFQALGGVAVIGSHTWAVLKGRRALKVEWNDGAHAVFDSAAFKKELLASVAAPATVCRDHGNVDAEFAKGGTAVEATYYTPLAAHAAMEPPAAVAEIRDGKAIVWAPTQNPQAVRDSVASALGLDKSRVEVHVTLLGGGFGRKSKPDYCVEAALLARRLGQPVKVVWTREDDVRHDYYHAAAAVYHKATVNDRGRPTAWLQRSSFPPIASTFGAGVREPYGWELDLGLTDLPFDVANIRAENAPADAHVRIGWFRAVNNLFHAFAAHSFADELAHAARRDPLEYLLDLIGPGQVIDLKTLGAKYGNYGAPYDRHPVDTRRLRRVLEIAGEQSNWAQRRADGRALGLAAHRSFNSYVASVVEVQADGSGGVRVPIVHMVIDAGVIVNPDRVRAQMEGSAVMGIGFVRHAEITALAGRVQQGNFHQFPVARMSDSPIDVRVHLVESDAPPTGVGEPGMPPVLPAFTNAIFAATGRRVRELPLSRTSLT